jgi:hypothetical protein
LDHICDSLNSVGAGIDDQLHDGWVDSYPAGHRHRRALDPSCSRTKTIVAIMLNTISRNRTFVVQRSTRSKRGTGLSAIWENTVKT